MCLFVFYIFVTINSWRRKPEAAKNNSTKSWSKKPNTERLFNKSKLIIRTANFWRKFQIRQKELDIQNDRLSL
jgi:hypothetical protein